MKKHIFSLLVLLAVSCQTFAQDHKPTALADFAAKVAAQTRPQILDARSAEEFALNHIEGAINLTQQTEGYLTILSSLDKQKPVFVYSIGNGRSAVLSKDLLTKGFTEVYELEGGIGSWVGGGKPLFTTAKKGLSSSEFNRILVSNKLVLVDIGSKYCGACKKVKPVLETLRQENGEALKIVEVELEESPALIASLKTVTSFPYLIVYKDGKPVLKKAGIKDLKIEIDQALAKAKVL
jgi:thiol-disulfide isomerase/thioredoxin